MPNESRPAPDWDTFAGEKAAQLRNHESRFLKAMKLLIEAGKVKSTDDLIRYAEQDNQTESIVYLRSIAHERLPVDLAYDALSVNLRMIAHKRNSSVLQQCLRRQVGLVMPLPPHVIDAFVTFMPVTILQVDGHHLPLSAEGSQARLVRGSRAVRGALPEINALVFEVFAGEAGYLIDGAIADVIDNRLRSGDTMLIVHLRPHQNPNDIPLSVDRGRIQLL